jgi:nicotinate phosphoribosyltransferase
VSTSEALKTDLYQLTMTAAAFEADINTVSTFEMFTRKLDVGRGFYLAAGLELVLDYLENLHFTKVQIDWLRGQHAFKNISKGFFEFLRGFRFKGDVWALPEGTPFFPDEPIIRITGNTLEAQLVETYLLSVLNQQTLIATKAARVVHAARGKHVSDFGTRRAHGPEAGVLAARAAFIGGCASTSNCEAGMRFGIPVKGTFAHSWVMGFDSELEAFKTYQKAFPDDTTILLDTYDPIKAAQMIVASDLDPKAVRLDSGDLAQLAKDVRKILNAGGFVGTKIVASNDLNEHKIAELEYQNAPIDIYGVGTELAVSKDMPALGGVYKLVERSAPVTGRPIPCMKLSQSKRTWPCAKQVYRQSDDSLLYTRDVLALASEPPHKGVPLLRCFMEKGKRTGHRPDLQELQAYAASQVAMLPHACRELIATSDDYCVEPSSKLLHLTTDIIRSHGG